MLIERGKLMSIHHVFTTSDFLRDVRALLDDVYTRQTWRQLYIARYLRAPDQRADMVWDTHTSSEFARWFTLVPRHRLNDLVELMRREGDCVVWSALIDVPRQAAEFDEQYNELYRLWLETPVIANTEAIMNFMSAFRFIKWPRLTFDNIKRTAQHARLATVISRYDLVSILTSPRFDDDPWLYEHVVDPFYVGIPSSTPMTRATLAEAIRPASVNFLDNAFWHDMLTVGFGRAISRHVDERSVVLDQFGRCDIHVTITPEALLTRELELALAYTWVTENRRQIYRLTFKAPRTNAGMLLDYELWISDDERRQANPGPRTLLQVNRTNMIHEVVCDNKPCGRHVIWVFRIPLEAMSSDVILLPMIKMYWGPMTL